MLRRHSSWGLLGGLSLISWTSLSQAVPLSFNVVDSDPKHPSGVLLSGSGNHAVRDSEGRLVVAYTLATQQSTQYYNYVKSSVDDGVTWAEAVRTETMPDSSSTWNLLVDESDNLQLGFGFNVGAFATRSLDHGATWQTEIPLLDGGWGAWDYSPQLALSTSGELHAVWHAAFGWNDPPYNVQHIRSTDSGATWTGLAAVSQIPNDDAAYNSGAASALIEAGPNGQLYLFYNIGASATNSRAVLRVWNGSAWGAELPLSTEGAITNGVCDMVVDSQGIVHIAVAERTTETGPASLVYRTYSPTEGTFSTPRTLSASGDAVSEISLGLYSGDALYIAYSIYDSATSKYAGVKLLRNASGSDTPELISTHPEARSPSFRYQYANFESPDKADLFWIEVNDVTGGEMLVHSLVTGGSSAPPVTGLRVRAYGPRIVNPGQDATFLVHYENGRDHALENVVISAGLPLEFPYVASTGGGQLRSSGSAQEVYWRLGQLPAASRGFLGVTLRIPWAVPNGTSRVQLRAGASGGVGVLTPTDFPATAPGSMTAQEMLDATAAQALASSNASVAAVLKAVNARGFMGPYGGERTQLATGKEIIRLFLVSAADGTSGMVLFDGTTPWAELISKQGRTVMDAQGGYRLSTTEGSFAPFGNWAVTHSPSVARCQANCTLNKVPGWIAELASKTVGTLSTCVDCVSCARSKGKDVGACAKCANVYHDVPGVGHAADVAECLQECLKDPNQHVCTEEKRECGSGWRATLAGWAGKSTVLVTPCNTVTGTYDPVSRSIYCDSGETCVAGDCVSEDEMCGPTNKAGYKDATCSLTPFEVVPAHDPNAKTVSPAGDVVPGQELTYTIEYENEGAGTAFGVFVLDPVSEKLDTTTLVADRGGTWSKDSGLVSWTVGDLEPKTGGFVSLKARVPEATPIGTEIFNVAEVHFPSAGEVTPTNPVYNVVRAVAAHPQALEARAGVPLSVTLSGTAVGTSAALGYEITRQPAQGTLTGAGGSFSYLASEGFVGQDSLEFVAVQGTTRSNPARVLIEVLPSAQDQTAPTVLSTSPSTGANAVRASEGAVGDGAYLPVITATLSESINPASVTAGSLTVEGAQGTVDWDAATRTLSFRPTAPLAAGHTYFAKVQAPLADHSGNTVSEYSWSFSTAARRALSVQLPTPAESLSFSLASTKAPSASQTVAAVSAGTEPVQITSVRVEGDTAQIFNVKEESCSRGALAGGESCFISVTAQLPTTAAGTAQLVITSDSATPSVTIPLTANLDSTDAPDAGIPSTPGTGGSSGSSPDAGSPDSGLPTDTNEESSHKTTTCSCRAAGAPSYPATSPWTLVGLLGLLGLRPLSRRSRRKD